MTTSAWIMLVLTWTVVGAITANLLRRIFRSPGFEQDSKRIREEEDDLREEPASGNAHS